MSKNKIQFQIGLSIIEFNKKYLIESNCRKKVYEMRWPSGFVCEKCDQNDYWTFERGSKEIYQCKDCNHQCSLTAGTLFEHSRLPLTIWFLAIHLISQSKNSVSALELHRQLEVNYKTAWLLKQKIMQMMYDRDQQYKLSGRIEIDDAYLGGKLEGGKRGRGSENKSPFLAAVQTNENGHPVYARFSPVSSFSRDTLKNWADLNISQGSHCVTDGLDCFNSLKSYGTHEPHIISKEGHTCSNTTFYWVNTVLSNVKTSLSGTFHSLNFDKYGYRYLADLQFRFNRRFDLKRLFYSMIRNSVSHSPTSRKFIESAEYG